MSVKQDRQGVRTATDLEQKYQFGKKFAELMGIATDARESVDSLASTLRNEMKEQVTSIIRDTEQIVLTALEDYAKTEDVSELESSLKSELEITADRITASVEEYTEKFVEVDEDITGTETALRSEIEAAAGGISMTVEEHTKKIAEVDGKVDKETADLRSDLELLSDKMTLDFEGVRTSISEVNGQAQSISEELEKHFEFGANGLTIKAGENAMQLVLDNGLIAFERNGHRFGWWDGVDFHTGNIVVKLNERLQVGPFAYIPRSNGSMDFLKVGD